MTILLSDPRVRDVPVAECGDPLVAHDDGAGGAVLVRSGLAARLTCAQRGLGPHLRLHLVEGLRDVADQRMIIEDYAASLRAVHPGISPDDLAVLTSRFVAPVDVAPHVAGAAVDVTLLGPDGVALDMGTPIDATPEQSAGACYLSAPGLPSDVRANRRLLADTLVTAGLVNYPTEWWHWSYGDRYWALMTGAPAALYGPVLDGRAA
jgi:D-alanyl-D-alanine dipeptidase